MGEKTKIDWCDSTWNPVTGCEHGCPYCYARIIAKRFGTNWLPYENPDTYKFVPDGMETHAIIELDGMQARKKKDSKIVPAPYPLGFTPTFHRYLLDIPMEWKKPRTIFVCSMADLFGDWVPDKWIQQVFDACDKAPQHRYLFLTKNPKRYSDLYEKGIMPKGVKAWNKYFGCTITKPTDEYFYNNLYGNGIDHPGFISIEPIMEDFDAVEIDKDEFGIKWIIVGAETGNRKGKVIPKREWIEHIAESCRKSNIPIFMKESLRELMGAELRQEFPWEEDEHG